MKTLSVRRGGSRGFTMIEVLVAVLILSFGLLGFVGLQARAIQFSVDAEDTNRAALLANDMATTMVTKNTVDTVQLATDIAAWAAHVADTRNGGLPNGAASVSTSGSLATLTITWRPTSVNAASANATNRYVTQVLLP